MPDRFLWWWRASRVIHDRNLAGADIEVIDEFPFFSFLLADNHPHLLALPFVLLAIAFALQIFRSDRRSGMRIRLGAAPSASRRWLYAACGLIVLLALGRVAAVHQTTGSWLAALGGGGALLMVGGLLIAGGALLWGVFLSGAIPSSMTAAEMLWGGLVFGALGLDFPPACSCV